MAVLSFVLLLSVAPSDDVTVELVTEDVEAAAVTDVARTTTWLPGQPEACSHQSSESRCSGSIPAAAGRSRWLGHEHQ